MNYQNITIKVYKKVPASTTKRGIIQRAMRNGIIVNLARHCGLCKRSLKRYMNIAYKRGQLDGY